MLNRRSALTAAPALAAGGILAACTTASQQQADCDGGQDRLRLGRKHRPNGDHGLVEKSHGALHGGRDARDRRGIGDGCPDRRCGLGKVSQSHLCRCLRRRWHTDRDQCFKGSLRLLEPGYDLGCRANLLASFASSVLTPQVPVGGSPYYRGMKSALTTIIP